MEGMAEMVLVGLAMVTVATVLLVAVALALLVVGSLVGALLVEAMERLAAHLRPRMPGRTPGSTTHRSDRARADR